MDDQVIIVGGGLAGLTCACALARAGRPVRLLDAGAELGGRAATTEHGQYLLNRGAHALYPSSERLLSAVGVEVSGQHPRPAAGMVLRAGELLRAPFDPRALLGPGLLSPGERMRFVRTMAVAGTGRPERLAGADAASWVSDRASTPALADLLGGLLRLSSYCGELSALPAEIGVGMFREALRKPVRYVDGGWRQIVDALSAAARGAGAEIHSSARVSELLVEEGIAGVRLTDGREHRAHTVVLAGLSPARAGRMLGEAGGGLPTEVAEPRPVRAACLDIALSELPRPECPFVLGLDEPLYLSVHSRWSRLAPAGGAVVQLLRYDDGGEMGGDATLERLESLLDQAQAGWRERIVARRFAPRMTVVHHLPAPGAGLAARPRVDDTSLPGAFLAGDWVGAHGWLAGASLNSAMAAAEAVQQAARSGRPDAPGGALATALTQRQ
jgi:phytoene dehydrogenase-like protein